MATPTLVQHVTTSDTRNLGAAVGNMHLQLPNMTGSGNCGIVSIAYEGGSSISSVVSKDVNGSTVDTFTLVRTVNDATNSQKLSVYKKDNMTSGARRIDIVISVAATFCNFHFSEFMNVSSTSADGDNGTTQASSTTWQPGSITPTVDGDLIYHVGSQDSAGTSGWYGTGFTPDTGFTLLTANTADGICIQYKVQTTAAAINPTITASSALRAPNIVLALKSASAGTALTGIHIEKMSWWTVPVTSTTYTVQMPCSGDLLVLGWDGFPDVLNTAATITSITDTGSNTWTRRAQAQRNTGVTISTNELWDTKPVSVSGNLKLTVTVDNGTTNARGSLIVMYDITGSSASPFDTSVTANGNQSTGDGPLTLLTITPSTINGLVIMNSNQDIGTQTGFTSPPSATAYFDSPWYDEEDGDPNYLCEDRPVMHVLNADLSPLTFTVTGTQTSGVGVDDWVAVAAAWKSGSLPNEPRYGSAFQKSHRPAPFRPGLAR